MALRAYVPVRLSQATRARLEAIAAQSGLSVSDLVRRATEEFLDEIEAKGEITISMKGKNVAAFHGQIHDNRRVAESRAEYGTKKKPRKKKA
jgi:hypothetical protein